MTFSIIGIDPENEMIGSAVASRWTGIGGCVQFFRPEVGFVNIQNTPYAQVAHRVLDLMESDDDIEHCVSSALGIDTAAKLRQFVVCSLKTHEFHVHSGTGCEDIFTHKVGKHCAAAGNSLADKAVIRDMVKAFENSQDLPLAERLLLALEAGQAEGGDSRGQEAASIQAYQFSYPMQRFYPVDLRVDSHKKPLQELRRLYEVFKEHDRRYELAQGT